MNPHVKLLVEGSSVPRIVMLSCHDANYYPMAEKTVYENKADYAMRWGYELMTLTEVSPPFYDTKIHANGITWDRLNEAVNLAKSGKYDWLYLVGCDTLITNMTIPLTTFIDETFHFIIANDCNGWNADSFLFKCSPEAITFMEAVMKEFDRLKYHCWVEQQAMIELRNKYPGIWKTLPQRTMNAYDYELYPAKGGRDGKDYAGNDGQWQPGDFLIHWAGLFTHIRNEQIVKRWKEIVR